MKEKKINLLILVIIIILILGLAGGAVYKIVKNKNQIQVIRMSTIAEEKTFGNITVKVLPEVVGCWKTSDDSAEINIFNIENDCINANIIIYRICEIENVNAIKIEEGKYQYKAESSPIEGIIQINENDITFTFSKIDKNDYQLNTVYKENDTIKFDKKQNNIDKIFKYSTQDSFSDITIIKSVGTADKLVTSARIEDYNEILKYKTILEKATNIMYTAKFIEYLPTTEDGGYDNVEINNKDFSRIQIQVPKSSVNPIIISLKNTEGYNIYNFIVNVSEKTELLQELRNIIDNYKYSTYDLSVQTEFSSKAQVEIAKCLKNNQWVNENLKMKTTCFGEKEFKGEQSFECYYYPYTSKEYPILYVITSSTEDLSFQPFVVTYIDGTVKALPVTETALHDSHNAIDFDDEYAINTYYAMGHTYTRIYKIENGNVNIIKTIGYEEDGTENNTVRHYRIENKECTINEYYNELYKYSIKDLICTRFKLTADNVDLYILSKANKEKIKLGNTNIFEGFDEDNFDKLIIEKISPKGNYEANREWHLSSTNFSELVKLNSILNSNGTVTNNTSEYSSGEITAKAIINKGNVIEIKTVLISVNMNVISVNTEVYGIDSESVQEYQNKHKMYPYAEEKMYTTDGKQYNYYGYYTESYEYKLNDTVTSTEIIESILNTLITTAG